ncbi:MAG: S41 family peptidase [Caldilineaceae bacterium]
MQSALVELRAGGAERFILDLRDNPGGPVEPALQMADMWVDDGLLLIKEFANGEQERSAAVQPHGRRQRNDRNSGQREYGQRQRKFGLCAARSSPVLLIGEQTWQR